MNLVSIVIEGEEQNIHRIKDELGIAIDSSWRKGTQTPSGKLREKSGITACISDRLTPFAMMQELVDFLHYLDNKKFKFQVIRTKCTFSYRAYRRRSAAIYGHN